MLSVPIWEKANLTLEEAAAYYGIGINKLRALTEVLYHIRAPIATTVKQNTDFPVKQNTDFPGTSRMPCA